MDSTDKDVQSSDIQGSLDDLIFELSNPDNTINTVAEPSHSKIHEDVPEYKLSSFPTEMKCYQAFDELVACYSLGGQLRHVYRHGDINYCHEKWDKMRFCLGVKVYSEQDRKKRIAKYYMERLASQKLKGGNSEDIWKVRHIPLDHPFEE